MKNKKLGGWLRLWIVISVMYAIVLGLFTWSGFPDVNVRSHDTDLYDAIPVDLKGKLVLDITGIPGTELEGVQMPNEHILWFRKTPKTVQEQVAKAYWTAVEKKISTDRRDVIWQTFFVWLVPVSLLFVLGLAIGWVYRGFKTTENV